MGGTKTEAIFLFIILLLLSPNCNSVPILSTDTRWIVNQSTGKRVKLACVNWISHSQTMIAEGLEKQPLSYIASQIVATGFNCVRFTWPTFMFTRPDYYNQTVSNVLDQYGLSTAKAGIARNNPQLIDMQLRDVHRAVVGMLAWNNLLVVLDNHVSRPDWCCDENDGNGFFGDASFDPNEWLEGLAEVARTYKGYYGVVGMSLRNELRGKRQNEVDWYNYMQQGANTVHKENPDFLVILSGLSFDTNLGFLKATPLATNLDNKLVYEAHWYSFGVPADKWTNQTNSVCADITQGAWNNFLFLTGGDNPSPLILSEFGADQSGSSEADNRYMGCLLAVMAEKDMDWALWTFQGSYMLRQGTVDMEEFYGVMDLNWDRPRNPGYLDRLQLIRQMHLDPNSDVPSYFIMFHPQSGLCVQVGNASDVFLDNCKNAARWDGPPNNSSVKLAGRPECLKVGEDGDAPTISDDCSTNWKFVSSSGLQLGAQDGSGKYLCLEKNGDSSTLLTISCHCVDDDLRDLSTCDFNPEEQWFKFVPANVV